jgi:hypothetical protein
LKVVVIITIIDVMLMAVCLCSIISVDNLDVAISIAAAIATDHSIDEVRNCYTEGVLIVNSLTFSLLRI